MIELYITMTGKSFSPKDQWQKMGRYRKAFNNKAEAMEYLRDTYGKSKRGGMYRDTKDGKTIKIGYVIGFRNADYSHAPVQHWIQQDWVEFRECKTIELSLERGGLTL